LEHRVAPSSREILPGIRLEVSTVGGYSVTHDGAYIGWIHASVGDRWNAYQHIPGDPLGEHLGRFNQTEAVRRIAAAGRNAGQQSA
jgi:hypothetical protein